MNVQVSTVINEGFHVNQCHLLNVLHGLINCFQMISSVFLKSSLKNCCDE